MFFTSKIKYLILFILLNACQAKTNIDINNKDLSLVKGLMLYKKKPFSGILFSKIDTLIIYKTTYVNGQKNGIEQKFFFNGDLAEQRFYTKGKKSGTHRAWWNKDQLKYEYHFDNNANYNGILQEWYSNGQLLKKFNYINGKEDGTQKMWDATGRIKANYSVINGERFGLIESKNCKPIANVK